MSSYTYIFFKSYKYYIIIQCKLYTCSYSKPHVLYYTGTNHLIGCKVWCLPACEWQAGNCAARASFPFQHLFVLEMIQPRWHYYVQHALRSHLLHCLENGNLTQFPQRERKKKEPKPLWQSTFVVFCCCRLPESGKMIQCGSCDEWFHSECVKVPNTVWENTNIAWQCDKCK